MSDTTELLTRARELAIDYLQALPRPPGRRSGGSAPRSARRWAAHCRRRAADPLEVDRTDRGRRRSRGWSASAGPRYFGFVIGGSLPAALAADWLASTWDQNAGLYCASRRQPPWPRRSPPAWLVELLGLPAETSVGFVTGVTMANFTALAAARHSVLARAGWDVEREGLQGAPLVTVVTHDGTHATVYASLQMLGLGREGQRVRRVAADDQGRMRPDALREELATIDGPVIVCGQVGNVNTGAFDPLDELIPIAHERGAWVHVDGAFGIWAAAVPSMRQQMAGHDQADSWSTDAHKWLNVPYDSGLVFIRDRAAHHAAMTYGAAYYVGGGGWRARPVQLGARVVASCAGLHRARRPCSLGRSGLADLIERDCALARRMAGRLAAGPQVRILNDVNLNQVLVRFEGPDGRCGRLARRCPDPRDGRRGPARRDVLARRDDLERACRHAGVGLELEDDRGGHRRVGRGHPALPRRGRRRGPRDLTRGRIARAFAVVL